MFFRIVGRVIFMFQINVSLINGKSLFTYQSEVAPELGHLIFIPQKGEQYIVQTVNHFLNHYSIGDRYAFSFIEVVVSKT